ncbi:MAG: type II secretion system F family protein [Actinomycetota bacterium]|nr:type II secretion system F family protein [Actinomycetota bacterium]
MKIAEILLALLTALLVFIIIFYFRRNDFESFLFNKIFINKLKSTGKSKARGISEIEFYMENCGNIKIFGFKIDSREKLLILKIFFSFIAFILINVASIVFKKNYIVISIIGALIFFLLPSELLRSRLNSKRNKVLAELPDFIDILFSLINAGLNLDESIKYFMENYNGEIRNLLKSFRIKQMEGFSKKEAYEYIGRISFCEEFNRVVKVLSQSEIIGNPIKNVLRSFSIEIRNNQKDQLKIKAEKLENNLILIIFIFIFIPVMLVFLVPVFPQIRLLF